MDQTHVSLGQEAEVELKLRGDEKREALTRGIEETDPNWTIGGSVSTPPARGATRVHHLCLGPLECVDGRSSVETAMGLLEIVGECLGEPRVEIVNVRWESDPISDELFERSPETLESGGGTKVLFRSAA